MLENKDYCDYDTCVALKELGFDSLVDWYFKEDKSIASSLARYRNTYIPRISLYEAQKWLREEKKLIVLVGFDFCPITSEIVYNWVIVVNGNTAKKSSYTYDYFEEALSEGLRTAVKILKEDETIHE